MEITHAALPHYLSAEDFYQQAERLAQTALASRPPFALVSLDFDHFNFINDLFSYEIGDQVLARLAHYFSQQLEEGEQFSRLHADHFVFLVHAPAQADIVRRFCAISNAKDILAGVLPSHYSLVCSGGVVYINEYTAHLSALLDRANFARKQAKRSHVSTFLQYDGKMREELSWRKIITLMMEPALQNHEFEMYLQPKVLLQTGQMIGAEALARWNSREYGMLYPDRFIPILEQSGFIQQLDFFMLEEACRFLSASSEQGIPLLPISVNFSKLHIRTADFVTRVAQVVDRYKLPTHLIEIEFTENIYLHDFRILVDISHALKRLGFRVALDDFGSAYSSLNCLKDLPLDIIKIDKGFLNSGDNCGKGRVIISKVVEMIKALHLVPIMEGVETAEQAEFLKKLSCDFGQGYFFARPMPEADYISFVKQHVPPAEDFGAGENAGAHQAGAPGEGPLCAQGLSASACPCPASTPEAQRIAAQCAALECQLAALKAQLSAVTGRG